MFEGSGIAIKRARLARARKGPRISRLADTCAITSKPRAERPSRKGAAAYLLSLTVFAWRLAFAAAPIPIVLVTQSLNPNTGNPKTHIP